MLKMRWREPLHEGCMNKCIQSILNVSPQFCFIWVCQSDIFLVFSLLIYNILFRIRLFYLRIYLFLYSLGAKAFLNNDTLLWNQINHDYVKSQKGFHIWTKSPIDLILFLISMFVTGIYILVNLTWAQCRMV